MVSKTSLIGILTGPTATGKSSLAIELALNRYPKLEIINADSLLVYREMNIGTAKPSPTELKTVPHHLIDIRSPNETFTAGEFVRTAHTAIEEIHQRGNRALIVGGTGFYLKALLFGLWEAPPADPQIRSTLQKETNETLLMRLQERDPLAATRIGLSDRYRLIRALEIIQLTGKSPTQLEMETPQHPSPQFRLWILDRPTEELHIRIQKRTQTMIQDGLIEEYVHLQKNFPEARALNAVGYKQVGDYLAQRTPSGRKLEPGLGGLDSEIQLATRQLVKQQRTWFKGQLSKVDTAQWFLLEDQRDKLVEQFKSVYQ